MGWPSRASQHRFVSNPRQYENFELFLNATGSSEHLTLEWSYNTDLFDASTVRGWMTQFSELVQRIAQSPTATIGALMAEQWSTEVAAPPAPAWHGQRTAYPRDSSMDRLFMEAADAHPERTALEMGDTTHQLRRIEAARACDRGHAGARGRWPRRSGGPLQRPLPGHGGRHAGRVVARCGVRAVRPRLSQGTAGIHVQRHRRESAASQKHLLDMLPENPAQRYYLARSATKHQRRAVRREQHCRPLTSCTRAEAPASPKAWWCRTAP
jgi:hypothetical protein